MNSEAIRTEPVLSARNVCRLFGLNKGAALKLLKQGANKDAILAKTGVTVALDNVSFDVGAGEIFAIIGLSGSGKSTIIRCLNLLQRPTSGNILFKGRDISKFSPREVLEYRRRHISMVFQNFGLMSHRDVLSNAAYGLEVRGVPKQEREQKAAEMLALTGLEGWERHDVASLSGGMRQRVGIARALAVEPDILLMDEAFSALDPLVRRDMQFELLSIQRNLGTTVIFITHDINEAFKMGDKVAIMREGRVEQMDTPEKMSAEPANEYVRRFITHADKKQILTARQVMVTPSCVVRLGDGVPHAIQEMRVNGVSSIYVVDSKMRFKGIVTIDDASAPQNRARSLEELLIRDAPVTSEDVPVSEIIPKSVEARFPLAVVDGQGRLKGLVTKASVLSSLI